MHSASGQVIPLAADEVLAGGGEMGARMRAFDWAQTPLGSVESWPQSLRTTVGIMLNSRYPMCIFWGPQLTKLYNDSFRPILGATKHPDALGQPGPQVWPEIWDMLGPMAEQVLTTGEAAWCDDMLLFMRRNGYLEDAYFTCSYSPIRDETGGIGGIFCVCTETTARVLAEHAAERMARLQAVTAALAEALTPAQVSEVIVAQGLTALGVRAGSIAVLTDNDTTFEILRDFGYDAEIISSWRRFSIDRPTPMAEAVRTIAPIWLESPAERANRYPDWAPNSSGDGAWAALPLLAKGRPIGALGLSFAEPRRFEAEAQAFMLTLAQQCAQALDRARLYAETAAAVAARDELLSVVSHDLKNPLATIKGYAQLLRRRITKIDSIDTTRLLDGLNKIDGASTRMSDQIGELLDTARLQADQSLDLDRQPIELVELIQQVVAEHQQTTQQHTIQFTSTVEELIGSYDAARVERVFANLLRNAIKYSPQGGEIAVELAHELSDDPSWAIIAVRDQGIGIPADDLPRIFERFHRAGNVAGQIQGTGIGLSSANQIVEQHGGTISVISEEGVGSTFTVRLPLEPVSSEF